MAELDFNWIAQQQHEKAVNEAQAAFKQQQVTVPVASRVADLSWLKWLVILGGGAWLFTKWRKK